MPANPRETTQGWGEFYNQPEKVSARRQNVNLAKMAVNGWMRELTQAVRRGAPPTIEQIEGAFECFRAASEVVFKNANDENACVSLGAGQLALSAVKLVLLVSDEFDRIELEDMPAANAVAAHWASSPVDCCDSGGWKSG